MTKLLVEGKTSLLEEFVSARTKRRFKAFLVKTPEGKVGFEFAPKSPKAPKTTRGKKAANTPTEPADAG
jgi:DNA topoisomerase-3